MITVGEQTYNLKYNTRTIEQVENLTKEPLMYLIGANQGRLSLGHLRAYFSNALYNTEGGKISPAQGSEIFDKALDELGYIKLTQAVIVSIERDCPFFFQGV